jgi:hypothetical protein
MFDNLMKLVMDHAGDAIIKNPAIPNERNDEAVKETTNSIVNSLKGKSSGIGGGTDIMSMLQGGNALSLTKLVEGNVAGDLMKKFGVDNKQAGEIVGKMLPGIMSQFVSKTNDPKDSSFDLGSIMNYLK